MAEPCSRAPDAARDKYVEEVLVRICVSDSQVPGKFGPNRANVGRHRPNFARFGRWGFPAPGSAMRNPLTASRKESARTAEFGSVAGGEKRDPARNGGEAPWEFVPTRRNGILLVFLQEKEVQLSKGELQAQSRLEAANRGSRVENMAMLPMFHLPALRLGWFSRSATVRFWRRPVQGPRPSAFWPDLRIWPSLAPWPRLGGRGPRQSIGLPG